MSYIPKSDSVVAFQSDSTKLQVGATIVGGSITTVGGTTGNSSVQVVNFPANQNVISSVVSIIPGAGALHLGKLVGSVASDGDVGVAALAKLEFTDNHTDDANGGYDNLFLTAWHELKTRDQRAVDIANCNNASVFTVLGNDTTTLADTADHVFGKGAISFNKADGSDNTVFAGVKQSFVSIDLSETFESGAFVGIGCKLPTLTAVDYVFCRLGTDASNYNEWTWPASTLSAGQWMPLRSPTNQPASYAGTGWQTTDLKYNAFGVAFTSVGATATGIKFDNVHLVAGRVTDSTIDATVSTNVTTPNINIQRVGGVATATNTGNANSATLRVVQAANAVVNVAGSVASWPRGNQSVSGSVGITGTPSISGAVTIVGSSSIATLQGTSPWLITGSVAAVQTGAWNLASMRGVYAEDSAHATADQGMFMLGVRNDNMASMTSADGDYSPMAVGPSGERIVANAPITKWVSATSSVMSGPSVLMFSAPGASVFNYVSGVQVTNPGTVSAHVAFYEGLGGVPASVLFYAMAPAGGGSNMVFPNPIKTTLANQNISASVSAHASVYVMMEGFTAKQLN